MKFYLPEILVALNCIISIDSTPFAVDVEQNVLKIANTKPHSYLNSGKVAKQNNANTGTATNQGGNANVPAAVTNFIGSNVVDIVSSSLTGNFNGVLNGGLNLLNTNNRVNNLFGGVFGGTVPSPLGNIGSRLIITPSTTARAAATQATTAQSASTVAEEGDDGEEDYDNAKD